MFLNLKYDGLGSVSIVDQDTGDIVTNARNIIFDSSTKRATFEIELDPSFIENHEKTKMLSARQGIKKRVQKLYQLKLILIKSGETITIIYKNKDTVPTAAQQFCRELIKQIRQGTVVFNSTTSDK